MGDEERGGGGEGLFCSGFPARYLSGLKFLSFEVSQLEKSFKTCAVSTKFGAILRYGAPLDGLQARKSTWNMCLQSFGAPRQKGNDKDHESTHFSSLYLPLKSFFWEKKRKGGKTALGLFNTSQFFSGASSFRRAQKAHFSSENFRKFVAFRPCRREGVSPLFSPKKMDAKIYGDSFNKSIFWRQKTQTNRRRP